MLAMATSSGAVMAFTFSLFIAPLEQEFGWPRATVSLGFSAMTLSLALAAPVTGRLLDRWGVRRTLIFAVPLFALSIGALSLAPKIPAVYLLFFALAGIFGSAHSPIPYAKLVAAWFDDHRGLALGIAMSGIGLGGAILPQIVRVLIDNHGWRAGFRGLSIAILVIGMSAVLFLVRERPAVLLADTAAACMSDPAQPGVTLRQALRNFRFWAIAVFVLFLTLCLNGSAAHAMPLLTAHGVAPGKAASMLVALGLSSLLGRLLTGYLLDRMFAPRVAALVCALALLGLALLVGGDGTAALAAIVCLGFSLGAEVDVMSYLVSRYFGLRHFGALIGCMLGIFSLAAAVGAPLAGLAHDMTGSYTPALIGFGAGLLLAIIFVLRLGPYRYPETMTPAHQRAARDGSRA
jgi:MFS family permease